MSARGLVGVRIGGQVVPLLPDHSVGVAEDDKPEEGFAFVRCDACGATARMATPVTYKFYDDDHYGRIELWYESRHAGDCAACAAKFEIELSYTLTKYPTTGRVELCLGQLQQASRRINGATLVLADAAALAGAAQSEPTPAPKAPPPIARSSAECHLYMALNPCLCGEGAPPAGHSVVQGNDALVAQYRGQCAKCGRAREFDFALDPETPPLDAFGGSRPSRLICPGQFALHSDRLAARWPADTATLNDAQRAQAREDLAWAIRALEEVRKFVPEGGDAVPAAAFTSTEGRAAYEAEPGRFRAIRLQARLGAYGQLLTPPVAAPPATAAAPAEESLRLLCVDVDPGRNRFAVGREDGTVIIADLATGTPQRSERLHSNWIHKIVFDGDVLWTAGLDGEVVAWDLALGEVRRRFNAGHGRVIALCMAGPDRLLTAGDDGNARLWDKAGGAPLQVLDEKRFGAASSVAATSGWIAIGYRDGHSGFWEPASAGAAAPWTYAGYLESSGRRGSAVGAIAVNPAGDLAAIARDRRVNLYTPGKWSRVAELQCDLACNDLQFDSKGEAVVGACSERLVRLWRRELVEPPGDRQRRGRRPMKPGARLVPIWNQFGDYFGAGMLGAGTERLQWEETMIYSGARFAGDDRIIATSFDGTVQLLVRARWERPRVARFGVANPQGWSE